MRTKQQSGLEAGRRSWSGPKSTPTPPGSVFRGKFQQFEPDLPHARMNQADFPGDTIGYINFATFLIGTPVIDTHQFEAAVSGVHYTDQRPKRQVGMGGRYGFGVE